MAPNHSVGPDYLSAVDNCRCSPNMLQIDFMRSLNLSWCAKKSSDDNLDNASCEKQSVKSCSVILRTLKCEICGQLLINKSDVENHKNLHRHLGDEKNNNSLESSKSCDNDVCTDYTKSNYKKNNSLHFIKLKKPSKRRRSKHVTKLTIKIGHEVISKVYCKNKYLDKSCLEQNNKIHDTESCNKCAEIKETLHKSPIMNTHAISEKQHRIVQSNVSPRNTLKEVQSAQFLSQNEPGEIQLEVQNKKFCSEEPAQVLPQNEPLEKQLEVQSSTSCSKDELLSNESYKKCVSICERLCKSPILGSRLNKRKRKKIFNTCVPSKKQLGVLKTDIIIKSLPEKIQPLPETEKTLQKSLTLNTLAPSDQLKVIQSDHPSEIPHKKVQTPTSSDSQSRRLRELAFLLVEEELKRIERKKLIQESSTDEESNTDCEVEDVPVVQKSGVMDNNEISVLTHIKPNTTNEKNQTKECEIITIEDDDDDDTCKDPQPHPNTMDLQFSCSFISEDSENVGRAQIKNFEECSIKQNLGLPLRLINS